MQCCCLGQKVVEEDSVLDHLRLLLLSSVVEVSGAGQVVAAVVVVDVGVSNVVGGPWDSGGGALLLKGNTKSEPVVTPFSLYGISKGIGYTYL